MALFPSLASQSVFAAVARQLTLAIQPSRAGHGYADLAFFPGEADARSHRRDEQNLQQFPHPSSLDGIESCRAPIPSRGAVWDGRGRAWDGRCAAGFRQRRALFPCSRAQVPRGEMEFHLGWTRFRLAATGFGRRNSAGGSRNSAGGSRNFVGGSRNFFGARRNSAWGRWNLVGARGNFIWGSRYFAEGCRIAIVRGRLRARMRWLSFGSLTGPCRAQGREHKTSETKKYAAWRRLSPAFNPASSMRGVISALQSGTREDLGGPRADGRITIQGEACAPSGSCHA